MTDPCNTRIEPKRALAVTEAGFYGLVLESRKPEAKRVKRWLKHDVLPSIRKTGQYSAKPMTPAELCLAQAQAMVDLERKQREQEAKVTALEAATTELEQAVAGLVTKQQERELEAAQALPLLPPALCEVEEASYGSLTGGRDLPARSVESGTPRKEAVPRKHRRVSAGDSAETLRARVSSVPGG
jgi:hypothetical protein